MLFQQRRFADAELIVNDIHCPYSLSQVFVGGFCFGSYGHNALLHPLAADFHDDVACSSPALYKYCHLSAEQMHLGKVEHLEAGRVSVSDSSETSGTADLYFHKPVVVRNRIPFGIDKTDIYET